MVLAFPPRGCAGQDKPEPFAHPNVGITKPPSYHTLAHQVCSYTVTCAVAGRESSVIAQATTAQPWCVLSGAALRPNTKYVCRVQTHGNTACGSSPCSAWTDAVLTPPGVPHAPEPPRLAGGAGTTLKLSWSAPYSGGAQILSYVLLQRESDGDAGNG